MKPTTMGTLTHRNRRTVKGCFFINTRLGLCWCSCAAGAGAGAVGGTFNGSGVDDVGGGFTDGDSDDSDDDGGPSGPVGSGLTEVSDIYELDVFFYSILLWRLIEEKREEREKKKKITVQYKIY